MKCKAHFAAPITPQGMANTFEIDGIPIVFLIGKHAKNNSELVTNAHERDLWFHVADMPSAHGIAEIHNMRLTRAQYKRVIFRGASILKARSKYRMHNMLKITFAEIKHVHTTAIPGLVTLGLHKHIYI